MAHCIFFILPHSEGETAAINFIHKKLTTQDGLKLLGGPVDTGFMLSHAPLAFNESVSWYENAFIPNIGASVSILD